MLYAGANSKLLGAGNDFSTYLNAAKVRCRLRYGLILLPHSEKNGCSSYINGTLFYRDVGLISHKAHSLKRPFWGVCHCQSKVNFDHEFPTPTEAMLRFRVFATIAAGARGIVFDSYCLTPNNNIQTYLLAPMDSKGNKTPIWHYLKKVITEARSYGDRFMGIEFIECRYTGYAIPGMTHMSGSFGVITRMSTSLAGLWCVIINQATKTICLYSTEMWITFKILSSRLRRTHPFLKFPPIRFCLMSVLRHLQNVRGRSLPEATFIFHGTVLSRDNDCIENMTYKFPSIHKECASTVDAHSLCMDGLRKRVRFCFLRLRGSLARGARLRLRCPHLWL